MATTYRIYRNPVPGTLMKQPLRCVDLSQVSLDTDALESLECSKRYRSIQTRSQKYLDCPGNCDRGTFLYPRKLSRHGWFHFHQGIDLGKLDPKIAAVQNRKNAKELPILSVCGGRVVHVQQWDGKSDGYGTAVAIFSASRERLYWYAHCFEVLVEKDDEVREHQKIATVGNSGNAGDPHLHFEVIHCPVIGTTSSGKPIPKYTTIKGGEDWERELGDPKPPRLNPLEELEKLGPWGPQNVYLPSRQAADPDATAASHAAVEQGRGGFFPLGVNNFWHGGVHLSAPAGTRLHAPFSGHIVALRLGSIPEVSDGAFGSANFLLLRHEISEEVFLKMQEKPSAPGEPSKPAPKLVDSSRPESIGRRASDTNPPDRVEQLKRRLHELGHYKAGEEAPTFDGSMDRELIPALKSYQSTLPSPYSDPRKPWPDGVTTVGKYTWNALFPEATEAPEGGDSDSKPGTAQENASGQRVVYSLFMHLGARQLEDVRDNEEVTWVTRARLPKPATEDGEASEAESAGREDEGEEADEAEEEADRIEASSHHLQERVARGSTNTPDIEWVEARLIRFGLLTGRSAPSGVADEALHTAIVAFQRKYAFPSKPKFWDGAIEPGKGTEKALHKTRTQLVNEERSATAKEEHTRRGPSPIDPEFKDAVAQGDGRGMSAIVSGLSIPVEGGEPLWVSGSTIVPLDDFTDEPREEVHWQVFSEELLFASWDTIDDPDDDLFADAPGTVLEGVTVAADEFVDEQDVIDFFGREESLRLRRTACRFRSEWGQDTSKTLSRFEDLDILADTYEQDVQPYQLWEAAADVLPQDPHVWHYNPIEFVRAYQEILDGLLTPETSDNEGHLQVSVRASNEMPPKETVTVEVVAKQTGTVQATAETNAEGEVRFHNLPVGAYEVRVASDPASAVIEDVQARQTVLVELPTQLEGTPPPRGPLLVRVRRVGNTTGKGATVKLEGRNLEGGPRTATIDGSSKVTLDNIPAGTYRLTAQHTGSDETGAKNQNDAVEATKEFDFDGKQGEQTIHLPAGKTTLTIVLSEKTPYATGTVTPEGDTAIPLLTNEVGVAIVTLKRSKVEVSFGKKRKKLRLSTSTMTVNL